MHHAATSRGASPEAEHPPQRQSADALRLEIAAPGKVSRDGVVWLSAMAWCG
jgi:hypothetical protein